MKGFTVGLTLFLLLVGDNYPQETSISKDWDQLVADFIQEYTALEVPSLSLSYVTNLSNISSLSALQQQQQLFDRLKRALNDTDSSKLSSKQQLEYDLLTYQLELNKRRLQLEKAWTAQPPPTISTDGLATIPEGKSWYAYFLQQWIDVSVTPEMMYAFGQTEVERVSQEMRKIQEASGMDSSSFQQYIKEPHFFYQEVKTVQQEFEQLKTTLLPILSPYFPGLQKIPDHAIRRGTNPIMAKVPAYYNNNTFYYNFFDQPFNRRQLVWIYLHEAVPGHHYERHYSQQVSTSDLQDLFWVPCYTEGWAAYVEDLGREIGVFRDQYDELGKWEWDIIRSVRVVLDVGLNYYGWTDQEALQYWRKYIVEKDDIAQREIARMKRWPCQVITYKYGGQKIMSWKKRAETTPNFSLLAFHEQVLGRGPLPISILDKWIDL